MPVMEKRHAIRLTLDLTIFVIIAAPIIVFFTGISPYQRGFYCNDESIRYPYKSDTVPVWAVLLVGVFLPLILICICEKLHCHECEVMPKRIKCCGRTLPPFLWSLYSQYGVFLFACLVSQLITDVAKYTIGRLRPHFLSVCQPDLDHATCFNDLDLPLYVEWNCSETSQFGAHAQKDARLSFPSGHASFSAVTMIYLVLYLQSRLNLRCKLVRPFLQLCCVAFTVYTSLSRISDYKHHWSDVMAGFVLGTTVAATVAVYVGGLREGGCRFCVRHRSLGGRKVSDTEMRGGDSQTVTV